MKSKYVNLIGTLVTGSFLATSSFAIELANFASTPESYWSTDTNLSQTVTSTLGSNYRVADWNDISNYINGGGSLSSLSFFDNRMVTLNGGGVWCCNRQYFTALSARPGQAPFDREPVEEIWTDW